MSYLYTSDLPFKNFCKVTKQAETIRNYRKQVLVMIKHCLRNSQIGHVRYINILTWLRGFLVKLLYLVLFSLYLSLFWELEDKRNLKNLQFWPESHAWILIYRKPCLNIDILKAMLEYWYIERGLLTRYQSKEFSYITFLCRTNATSVNRYYSFTARNWRYFDPEKLTSASSSEHIKWKAPIISRYCKAFSR